MCGFFGEIGKSTGANITEIHKSILHRGPDDFGYEIGTDWMLGFNRLSILDLSKSGHQPMWDISGRYIIVFNGEIYNYKELKHAFCQGMPFRSSSDTEVLLNMLIEKGEDALRHLNGMFAFIFIDTQTGNFIAARDRVGVKPFYYYYDRHSFRFASELKALLKWPAASKNINNEALNEYLFLNYISGNKTIFNDYYKLETGHYIKGNINAVGNITIKPYWEIPVHYGASDKSIADLEDEFEALFGNAVDIRLRSDVPVGIFLSGGIDSSLVSIFAGKTPHKDQITAFTVGFNEKGYNESDIAMQTAKQLGIQCKTIFLQSSQLSDIDILAKYYDEPFADSSALPSYHLCKAASEFGTVFLTGDGGDESFSGYKRYIRTLNSQSLQQMPTLLKSLSRVASGAFKKHGNTAYKLRKLGTPADISIAFMDNLPFSPVYDCIYSNDVNRTRAKWVKDKMEQHWLKADVSVTAKQQYWDMGMYLPDDILVKMDRASMANSIEVRSPFLDYRVMEWAATIPEKYLIDNSKGKKFLRDLCAKYLPASVSQAPKSGFGVPLNDWFANEQGNNFLKERITDSSFALSSQIKVNNLLKLADLHKSDKAYRKYGELFWSILMFDAWHRTYLN